MLVKKKSIFALMKPVVVPLTCDITGHTVPEQTYCFPFVHVAALFSVFYCSDINSSYSTFYYNKLFEVQIE